MKKVPNMISTKDLSYISDMFNWHLVAAKKYENYLNQMQDEDCLKKIEELYNLHNDICQDLINLLESSES